MLRQLVGVTSALVLIVTGTLQLRASQDRLTPMTMAEMQTVVGGDGWFEECVAYEQNCDKSDNRPDGIPCGNGCPAYCTGTQTHKGCEEAWFSVSCYSSTKGCDAEPYICNNRNVCIDPNNGSGPNPVSCGTFTDCD